MKTNPTRGRLWPVLTALGAAAPAAAFCLTAYPEDFHPTTVPAAAAVLCSLCFFFLAAAAPRSRQIAAGAVFALCCAALAAAVLLPEAYTGYTGRYLRLPGGVALYLPPFAFPAVAAAAGLAAGEADRRRMTFLWTVLTACPVLLTFLIPDAKIGLIAAVSALTAMLLQRRAGRPAVSARTLLLASLALAAAVPLLIEYGIFNGPPTVAQFAGAVLTGGKNDPLDVGWNRRVMDEILRHAQLFGSGTPLTLLSDAQFAAFGAREYGGLLYLLYRFGWAALLGTAACHGLLLFSLFRMTGALCAADPPAGAVAGTCAALVAWQIAWSYLAAFVLEAVRISVPLMQTGVSLFITLLLCGTVTALYAGRLRPPLPGRAP